MSALGGDSPGGVVGARGFVCLYVCTPMPMPTASKLFHQTVSRSPVWTRLGRNACSHTRLQLDWENRIIAMLKNGAMSACRLGLWVHCSAYVSALYGSIRLYGVRPSRGPIEIS